MTVDNELVALEGDITLVATVDGCSHQAIREMSGQIEEQNLFKRLQSYFIM